MDEPVGTDEREVDGEAQQYEPEGRGWPRAGDLGVPPGVAASRLISVSPPNRNRSIRRTAIPSRVATSA